MDREDLRQRALPQRLAILALWLVAAGYLAWQHIFWRDEVRALSLALRGDTWGAMLRGVQGEGHPALWYLLLRVGHDLVPVREVLPVAAGLIGVAAAVIFTFRSPFAPWRIALILFGAFFLFEYTVSARNYGISMLLLFVIADRYARHRDSGVLLGLLLALLCNTNVHSAFLAAALLLFWAIELLSEDGWRWTLKVRTFALNAGLAAIGAALCAVTVYPPVNDAAVITFPGGIGLAEVMRALFTPAGTFSYMKPYFLDGQPWVAPILALALIGAPFAMIRAPGALLSALIVLALFQLFFYLVYPGGYRHQSLYLVYLITMYWLVTLGRGGQWPARMRGDGKALDLPERIGGVLFVLLLALQVPDAVAQLAAPAKNMPQSRSREPAATLHTHGLDRAILVANADGMLEALPYYATNRLYFIRSAQFETVAPLTKRAKLPISLGDMLDRMRWLHARYDAPVVAVLQYHLDPAAPTVTKDEGFLGNFTITPDQARAFQAATTRIASFGPVVSDETYDVYVLR